jgi:hypothetical protein
VAQCRSVHVSTEQNQPDLMVSEARSQGKDRFIISIRSMLDIHCIDSWVRRRVGRPPWFDRVQNAAFA